MTVQEWLHEKLNDPQKREDYNIFIKFALNFIQINTEEEIALQQHLNIGQKRQDAVIEIVSKDASISTQLIKREVYDLMHMEPYAVFYKNYILKDPTSFTSIEDCVEKVKQIIATRPSEEEFLLDRQRGNFQQHIPYYGLEPFIEAVRNENAQSPSKIHNKGHDPLL